MSNWMVLVACAVVGWLLVSFLFRSKPDRDAAAPSGPSGGQLSLTFLSLKWHQLLGVAQNASDAEIDAAYYAIIGEFDRLTFDRKATDEQQRAALERRHGAAEAYQYIRAARGRR